MNSARPDPASTSRSPASRWIDAGFGLFLLVVSFVTLLAVEPDARTGAVVLAVVLVGLGVDAMAAAARGTRSLMSRIGPLP